jgi:hypothetical protein
MTNDKYGRMRPIDLNEPVSVTLPAHVWRGYMAAYTSTKWEAVDATSIMIEVQNALFDPLWMKEHEAEQQRRHDEHRQHIHEQLPDFLKPVIASDVPPDAGGFMKPASPSDVPPDDDAGGIANDD